MIFLFIFCMAYLAFMVWYIFNGSSRDTYNGSRDDGRD